MRRVLLTTLLAAVLLVAGALPALAQSGSITYRVHPGDTLSGIAVRFGVSQQSLISANHIAHPNRLFAGQLLLIPNAHPVYTPPTAPNPVLRPTYTVQPGDTLFAIALRYGVSTASLAQLNGIVNYSYIQAGRVLVLPSGASVQPHPAPAPNYGANPPNVQRPFRYYVQPGDSVSVIARRYGAARSPYSTPTT